MKLADIEDKAQNYFEWPDGVPRNSVTLTSATLFARACVNEAVAAERKAIKDIEKVLTSLRCDRRHKRHEKTLMAFTCGKLSGGV